MRSVRFLAVVMVYILMTVLHAYSGAPLLGAHESDTPAASNPKHRSRSLSSDNEFYESGTAFLTTCSAVDRVPGKQQDTIELAVARACQSYVLGLIDGVDLQHMWSKSHGDQTKAAFCVQFENLPSVQVVDAVLQYLRDNPDRRRFRASIAVEEALHNKFPCR